MGIYGALVGPRSENVEISLVLPLPFEGSRWPRGFGESEQAAEKCRLGGGRGKVNPPLGDWFGGFGRFGGVVT